MAIKNYIFINIGLIVIALWQLILIAILKQYLEPNLFGILMLITTGISFIALSGDFGISSYIFYKRLKNINESLKFLQVNFYISILIGMIASIIILKNIPDTDFQFITAASFGLASLFYAQQKPMKSLLEINKQFKSITIVEVVSRTLSLVIAYSILLEYSQPFLAASIAYLLNASVTLFIYRYFAYSNYFDEQYKVKKFDIELEFWNFCSKKSLDTILAFATRNLDIFLVAVFFTLEEVGIYGLLKLIFARPTTLITQAVNKINLVNVLGGTSLQHSIMKQVTYIALISLLAYTILIFSIPIFEYFYKISFSTNELKILITFLLLALVAKNIITTVSTPIIANGLAGPGLFFSLIQVLLLVAFVTLVGLFLPFYYVGASLFLVSFISLLIGYFYFVSKHLKFKNKVLFLSLYFIICIVLFLLSSWRL